MGLGEGGWKEWVEQRKKRDGVSEITTGNIWLPRLFVKEKKRDI